MITDGLCLACFHAGLRPPSNESGNRDYYRLETFSLCGTRAKTWGVPDRAAGPTGLKGDVGYGVLIVFVTGARASVGPPANPSWW
jgi:hypothetical protein